MQQRRIAQIAMQRYEMTRLRGESRMRAHAEAPERCEHYKSIPFHKLTTNKKYIRAAKVQKKSHLCKFLRLFSLFFVLFVAFFIKLLTQRKKITTIL